jgi:hypothetical protein
MPSRRSRTRRRRALDRVTLVLTPLLLAVTALAIIIGLGYVFVEVASLNFLRGD